MRNMLLLGLLTLLLFAVVGCSDDGGNLSASDSEKAQAISVINAEGNVTETITDTTAIKDFVTACDVDHWELEDAPENATAIGSFGLSQEKTVRLGEKSDGKLYDVAQLTLYDSHHIRCNIVNFIDVDFAIPDDAYDTLVGYFA